jgi:pimeloyl-ACP methyl ester carboxylesterase
VVSDVPEFHYTRSADGTSLAYQVSGSGPLDLVVHCESPHPLELSWDDPGFLRFSRRLGAFSRTVWFQGRGLGASEGDVLDFRREVLEADLVAVLDAAGAERPALAGCPSLLAIPFAVSHRERVSSLVLIDAWAHGVREDDYPWGVPPESLDELAARMSKGWVRVHSWSPRAPCRARSAETR